MAFRWSLWVGQERYNMMLQWFLNPRKALERRYRKKLGRAVEAQCTGQFPLHAQLIEESDAIRAQLEEMKSPEDSGVWLEE